MSDTMPPKQTLLTPFRDFLSNAKLDPEKPKGLTLDNPLFGEELPDGFLLQAKAVFDNPAFKPVIEAMVQDVWAAATKDTFEQCEHTAAWLANVWTQFRTLAEAYDEAEKPAEPVQAEVDPFETPGALGAAEEHES